LIGSSVALRRDPPAIDRDPIGADFLPASRRRLVVPAAARKIRHG
jgi:hypothetical protein